MSSWQRAFPAFRLFSSCPPDTPCIAPALYAVVGAASALGGTTRMTLSLVVIVFELTGAVSLVVQVMLAVLTSKFVGDYLSRDGIYEVRCVRFLSGAHVSAGATMQVWINLRRYSFVNPKVDFRRDDLTARECMTAAHDLVSLEADGTTLAQLEGLLLDVPFKGFPIVETAEDPILLGYIARPELEHALSASHARCFAIGRGR
jgi:chloride channel 3/4/5